VYDSATVLQQSLAASLHGRGFPMLGQFPGWLEPVTDAVLHGGNRLPAGVREKIALYGGVPAAMSKRRLARLDAENLARAVVERYPQRCYPAVLVGATGGAVVHLAAALGVPWLPQTVMVQVRNLGADPDDPRAAAADLTPPIRALLARNPGVLAYHHHDPNQDRVPIAGMACVRVKWLRLPVRYAGFLRRVLEPGGRIIFVNCTWRRPTTTPAGVGSASASTRTGTRATFA